MPNERELAPRQVEQDERLSAHPEIRNEEEHEHQPVRDVARRRT